MLGSRLINWEGSLGTLFHMANSMQGENKAGSLMEAKTEVVGLRNESGGGGGNAWK